jgi:hypothetical protein
MTSLRRFLLPLLLPALLSATEVTLTERGLVIAAGAGLGTLTLDYPALTGAGGSQRRAPDTVTVNGNAATLGYPGGAQLTVTLAPDGAAQIHATQLADGDKGLSLNMVLPAALAGKAKWSIKDSPARLLPAEKGADAFLWRGDATRFSLADAAGQGVSLVIEHGYQQLQDNRVWNTDTFQWFTAADLPRTGNGEAFYKFHVLAAGAAPPAPANPKPPADTLAVSLGEKGAELACGRLGTFTLAYPQLDFGDDTKRDPVETRIQGASATLAYEGGAAVTVTVTGGRIAYAFANAPAALKAFSTHLLIPPNFSEGGTWRAGEASGAFPPEKPAKPHLYQNHTRRFEFADINSRRLGFDLPEHTFVQVQDNREWNWNTFWADFKVACLPEQPLYEIGVTLEGAARRVVLVDRFGQTTRRDFPGKVGEEADLKKDAENEAAYYAALTPPDRNRFGGLTGSGARFGLKKTGFFHVEQRKAGGRDVWLLADPDGDAFFHLGVCTFGPGEDYTTVEKREESYDWLPPRDGAFAAAWHPNTWWNPRAASFYKANVVRKYGSYDDATQTARLVDRVRRVGFNSVGAFSPESPVFVKKNVPRVATLPLSNWTLGPALPGVRGVFDPFDAENLAKMEELFAKSVAPQADDPLLIGYFLDNEQGFEDLPRAIPALPGKHAAKRELVARLRATYKEDIAAFNAAWGFDAASFEALADRGLPVTTKAAFADMQAYTEHFLDTYYRGIVTAFRKLDTHHMLIGNRWQPGTANSETLCRVAGKYMDVISINYYACGIDEAFVRRLYEWSGRKPQMWSEFYFTASQESNVAAGNHDMATQRDRGRAYRHYVEGAAALGFVVGIEWFTLIDQAVTGRFFEGFNGERANTGLFNVADRPYRDLFAEMAKTHAAVYGVWLEGRPPFRFDEPRFTGKAGRATRTVSAGRATAPMAMDGQLAGWPGRPPERLGADRLALGRESGGTEAAFKVCWDEKALYLLANVTDPTPMKNGHTGGDLWNADVLELFIGGEKPEQGGALLFTDRQILLGAGKNNQTHVVNAAKQPAIETSVAPSVDGQGYTLEAALPWSALDIVPREGMTLLFDLALGNSADGKQRTSQLVWNGGPRNSSDRGGWGRLALVP